MAQSKLISGIIGKHGLQPGDNMMTLGGMVMLESVVVDSHTALYRQRDTYTLDSEDPITGERTLRTFSADAMSVIRGVIF